MHAIRFMRTAVAAAAAVLMVASCNQAQAIDGKYKDVMSGFFGLGQIEVPLEINGKTAIMDMPDAGMRFKFQLRRDGERFVLYEQTPDDGLTFNITNKGNTLICNQCDDMGIPKHWERQL